MTFDTRDCLRDQFYVTPTAPDLARQAFISQGIPITWTKSYPRQVLERHAGKCYFGSLLGPYGAEVVLV